MKEKVLGVEQQAAPLAAAQLKSSTCWAKRGNITACSALNTAHALTPAKKCLYTCLDKGR